jgi:hypothetical protein
MITGKRAWAAYPPTYRAREIAVLVGWMLAGESGYDLASFYRVIVRSLHESRARLAALEPELGTAVERFYRKVEDKSDAFLSQSALREALFLSQDQGLRLVLALVDPKEGKLYVTAR